MKRLSPGFLLAAAAVALVVIIARPRGGWPPGLPAGVPVGAQPARVIKVVDGDTLDVELSGRTERVRLVGVDTPEVYGQAERFGAEASEFTAGRLPAGTPVYLELDTEPRDRYGRLLGYLWLGDGSLFNELLLQQGYAQLLTIPPNVRYVERFTAAQKEARTAARGLWGTPRASAGFPPDANGHCQTGGREVVKGNINRAGQRIYHRPGDSAYSRTKAEACFASPAEAEAAGFRPAGQ